MVISKNISHKWDPDHSHTADACSSPFLVYEGKHNDYTKFSAYHIIMSIVCFGVSAITDG